MKITQISKMIEIVYQKDIKTSTRVCYAPPLCKRAQAQRLKNSQITIRVDEDQGLVYSEEVKTSPVL